MQLFSQQKNTQLLCAVQLHIEVIDVIIYLLLK